MKSYPITHTRPVGTGNGEKTRYEYTYEFRKTSRLLSLLTPLLFSLLVIGIAIYALSPYFDQIRQVFSTIQGA